MKLAVAGLMLLGLVAALCAAILVGAMKGTPQVPALIKPPAVTTDSGEVKVPCAARSLSAMTVIGSSDVTVKTMPRDRAPVGFATTPNDVIGKVLAGPIAEGAPFTDTMFSGQIGAKVSAVIPPGKRAVGISVSDYAGLDGLLYPGAMVDVLLSLRPESSGPDNAHHDALATTLIEDVPVLAIEQISVVSAVKPDDHNEPQHGAHRITLLVDTKQAKALDLGMQQGTLSLSLRNPMDDAAAEREPLSEGAMVSAAPIRIGSGSTGLALNTLEEAFVKLANRSKTAATPTIAPAPAPTTAPVDAQTPQPSQWEMQIIRSSGVETKTFVIPAADSGETAGTSSPGEQP